MQPSVIASRSFLSRPAMSSVLTTLEQRGLVERSAHPGDRRQALVEISAAGRELMGRLLPALHRAEAQFVDPALSRAQQEELLRRLARVQAHLEQLRGAGVHAQDYGTGRGGSGEPDPPRPVP